ncbi:GLPGLI family protein [Chryseobacterium sp.]|uniref:GLPGLI family protein n=1 Tax=Chryseobacterium sp. TaxID=1871047 RepID=UPI00289F78FB|nr:GLPGLI family protein [Chryseobacterium sp.]
MNSKFFFIAVFFALYFVNAQKNIVVEYTVSKESGGVGKEIFLKISNNISIFGKTENVNSIAGNETKDHKLYIKPKKSKLIFKDFGDKFLISNERIVLDEFIVRDSVMNINWKITKEEKNILGYLCKKAEAHFRGRDYVAYYTENINKSDGPWKLTGLPGLILEAFTKDNYIRFTAVNISLEDKMISFENPFTENRLDFETYSEFKNEYVKTYHELKIGKKLPDGHIIKSQIPKSNIEVYVE